MEQQPTTLSDVIRLIQEVLQEHYDIDPGPLFESVGIDLQQADVSGSRVSRESLMRLWEIAAANNQPYRRITRFGGRAGCWRKDKTYHLSRSGHGVYDLSDAARITGTVVPLLRGYRDSADGASDE